MRVTVSRLVAGILNQPSTSYSVYPQLGLELESNSSNSSPSNHSYRDSSESVYEALPTSRSYRQPLSNQNQSQLFSDHDNLSTTSDLPQNIPFILNLNTASLNPPTSISHPTNSKPSSQLYQRSDWIDPRLQSDPKLHPPLILANQFIPPLPSSSGSDTPSSTVQSHQEDPLSHQSQSKGSSFISHEPTQPTLELISENIKGNGKALLRSDSPTQPQPQAVSLHQLSSYGNNHPTYQPTVEHTPTTSSSPTDPLTSPVTSVSSFYSCRSPPSIPTSIPSSPPPHPHNVFLVPVRNPEVSVNVFKPPPDRPRPQTLWLPEPPELPKGKWRTRSMDVSLLAHKSYRHSEPSPRSIQSVTFLNPKRNSAQSIATSSKRWSQSERSAVTVDSKLSTLSENRVTVNPNRFNDRSSCTRNRRVRQKNVQEEEERLGVVGLSEIVARMGYSPEEVESSESNFYPSSNLKSKEVDLQPLTVDHTELFPPAINNTTSGTADSLMRSIDKPSDLRNQSSTYSRSRNRTSVYSLPPTRSITANAFQNYPRRRMTGMSNVHASSTGQGQKSIHPYRSLPTLVIPSGGFEPNADPSKISRQLFETRTHSWNPTMYALSLVAPIRRNVPIASQLKYGNSISSPNQLGTEQILIELHSVALDAWDLSILHTNLKNYENLKKSNHLNQNHFIPGRSFVGKVLDFGIAVKRLRRGDIVYGLQDIKKCGALAQQMVIDKDLVALAPVHSGLTIEQLACLPALGVPAHLVMSTICAGLPKGSKILILNGHKGLGAMMCDLVRYFRPGRDLWVTCHIPTAATSLEEFGIATGRCEARGAREVIVEESVLQTLNSIHESSYDIVIDTVGGRRIYDASRRILHHEGMFISCVGDKLRMAKLKDKVKMNMRSLRRTFIKKDQKKIGYWCLSPETDFDGQRQTIRDSLDEIRKLVEDSNHHHYQHDISLNLNEDPYETFGRPVTSHSSLSHSIGIEPVIGAIYSFEESAKAFDTYDSLKAWNQRMIIQEPIDDRDDQIDLITGSTVVVNIKKCPKKLESKLSKH